MKDHGLSTIPTGIQKPTLSDGYRYIGKQIKLGWQQYGSRICTIAGTVGLAATGIHACRKTYKIHDELEANGAYITAEGEFREGDKKGSRTYRKTKAFIKCAVKTSRHYAVDAVAGAVSAAAVAKGWQAEHQNYQQAAAMASVIAADFMQYRKNVIAEQGTDADRRYLTKGQEKAYLPAGKKEAAVPDNGEEHVLELNENSLRIWYSKETTPQVWSDSLILRKCHLNDIQERLTMDLIYGGSYTVNDVRRYFYGRQGDVGEGGLYGRIWDPGDPAHPERGALPNLHFQEDEDFWEGRTDSCWIVIDIDPEPLFELMKAKKQRDIARDVK